jgi:hypothetical protein
MLSKLWRLGSSPVSNDLDLSVLRSRGQALDSVLLRSLTGVDNKIVHELKAIWSSELEHCPTNTALKCDVLKLSVVVQCYSVSISSRHNAYLGV